MKKTLILIYSFCALAIIASGITWFVFILQSDSTHAKETAVQQLQMFAKRAAAILDEQRFDDTLQYYDAQESFAKLCKTYHAYIQAVLITDQTKVIFKWPQNTDIFSQDINQVVTVKHTPFFDSPAQITIPVGNEKHHYTVYASLLTVSINTVFLRGKIVFWIIFIVFIFTAILLILSYIHGLSIKQNTVEEWAREKERGQYVPQEHKEQHIIDDVKQEAEQVTEEAVVPSQKTEIVQGRNTLDIQQQLEALDKLHISKEPGATIEEKKEEPEIEQAPSYSNDTTVTENIDDVSDDKKEEYRSNSDDHTRLIEMLDDAITHMTVSEEDLTLLLVRIKDIAQRDDIIQVIKAKLDKINKIFMFDNDTLSIILYYAPLSKGMHITNILYETLQSFLDSISCNDRLSFGLTTRAGRLIPAHRMIEEAYAALNKTWEEDSDPIVAFRVNPEKYRQYIAKSY